MFRIVNHLMHLKKNTVITVKFMGTIFCMFKGHCFNVLLVLPLFEFLSKIGFRWETTAYQG